MTSMKRALIAAAAVVALSHGLQHRALAAEAVLNAVSYLPLPSSKAVTVETFDDSEESLNLQKIFEDALRARGYDVSPSAGMVLSIESRDRSGTWTGGGPNRLIELRNNQDHTGTDAPAVRLNIFDSNRGGLINPKRDPGITQVTPSHFRIDITIEDRSNGKRIWQGWSETETGSSDDLEARRAMVRPLVDSIGQTVREQRFPVN